MISPWLAQASEQGSPVLRIGRHGDDLVAEWPGIGTLVVDRAALHPRFERAPNADPFVAAKLEAGTVPALLRHLRGELTLHAAAIKGGATAIAMVGDPGAGKSTLAFWACSDPTRTWALLSDDALYLDDRNWAIPSADEGWLDGPARDALHLAPAGSKHPARPTRVADDGATLEILVHLTFSEALRVRRLRGREAARVLGNAMVRFVMDEPAVHRADLERLAELAARVRVVSLERPRGFEHLDAALRAIENLRDYGTAP